MGHNIDRLISRFVAQQPFTWSMLVVLFTGETSSNTRRSEGVEAKRSFRVCTLLHGYVPTMWTNGTLRHTQCYDREHCSSPTGSSAGAGSEVYHVYRHLRRRETVRQQWIQDQAKKEEKEKEFQEKLAANKAAAEERTAKKRAKRSSTVVCYVLNSRRSATNNTLDCGIWLFLCRLKRKHRLKEKRKVTSEVSAERSHSEEEEEEEGEKHFIIGGR